MAIFISYSMPSDPATWGQRIEAVCQLIERQFDVTLNKASAYRAAGEATEVADRATFLKKKCKTRTRWLHLFSDSDAAVGGCSYANPGVYNFFAQLPEIDPGEVVALFATLGDAVAAYSAHYNSAATARRLSAIQWRPPDDLEALPARATPFEPEALRLPRLANTLYGGLESPLQPHGLGWLNYWSADTASYIGFPDPRRDGALLRSTDRTPSGAWLVRLSKDVLDASRPDHLVALAEAYDRFPRVGVRA